MPVNRPENRARRTGSPLACASTTVFNANAQVEVEMPESTFFSPNNFTEEEYREKIAEQMGIDPDLVTVTPAGG